MAKKKKKDDYEALFQALYISQNTKRYAALKALLDAGLNPDSPNRDDFNRTVLFNYHLSGANAKLLLAAGADANYRDANGMVPLHSANAEVAALLLKQGADIEVEGGHQERATPLIAHALRGDAVMVKFLLGHGADVRATMSGPRGRMGVMEAAATSVSIAVGQISGSQGRHEEIYRLVDAHVGRGLVKGMFKLKSLRDLME